LDDENDANWTMLAEGRAMPMKCGRRIVATISAGVFLLSPALAGAQGNHVTVKQIPAAYRSVAYEFARSKIPVLVPTWLPTFHTKVYSGFYTFGKMPGVGGPGYGLDLYTSPTNQDHADEIAGIFGKAGDTETVRTHTVPVHLGKAGWAYIDSNPGTNAGYTITVVRAFTLAVTAQDFTYTIDRTCPAIGATGRPRFGCLEHVARSLARYTARARR
jgi:hypothetical protein